MCQYEITSIQHEAVNWFSNICNQYPDLTDILANPDSKAMFWLDDWMLQVTKEGHSHYSFAKGATKLCFLPKDDEILKEWVIKVNHYEEKNNGTNYCALEETNYLSAKENGLADFFAETMFAGTTHNIKVYIQKRAECNSYDIEQKWIDSLLNDSNGEESSLTEEEVLDLLDDMSIYEKLVAIYPNVDMSRIYQLEDFINNTDINDLNSGGFGYLDNDCVLIDYSGF